MDLKALIADAIEREIGKYANTMTVPKWMSPKEAAGYLGCTTQHLQNLRARRIGPVFVRFGRLIRYAQTDLDAYLSDRRIETSPSKSEA